jgi:hypothetical protein
MCFECKEACSSDCECWCHESERISATGYDQVFTYCNVCGRELVWQIEDQCGMCKDCMHC